MAAVAPFTQQPMDFSIDHEEQGAGFGGGGSSFGVGMAKLKNLDQASYFHNGGGVGG